MILVVHYGLEPSCINYKNIAVFMISAKSIDLINSNWTEIDECCVCGQVISRISSTIDVKNCRLCRWIVSKVITTAEETKNRIWFLYPRVFRNQTNNSTNMLFLPQMSYSAVRYSRNIYQWLEFQAKKVAENGIRDKNVWISYVK